MNYRINLFDPYSDKDIYNVTHKPVFTFQQLYNFTKGGKPELLDILLNNNGGLTILLEDRPNPVGHWISMLKKGNQVYYFSSYGTLPGEDLEAMSDSNTKAGGGGDDYIKKYLRWCLARGLKVHHNDVPYQKIGDGTQTCGYWSSAFLNNPKKFNL